MNIVKPVELQRTMRAAIDNPVIATNVRVVLQLHPALEFYRPEDTKYAVSDSELLVRCRHRGMCWARAFAKTLLSCLAPEEVWKRNRTIAALCTLPPQEY